MFCILFTVRPRCKTLFERIKKYLVLPMVLFLLALYFIGLRLWQNRSREILAPTVISNTSMQENESETEVIFPEKKLNINTATKEELMSIDGIGEVIALRILMKREELGSFKIIEQITQVDGIGQKTFDKIKNYIFAE